MKSESELVAVLTLVQVEVGGEVVDIVSQTSKPVSGPRRVFVEHLIIRAHGQNILCDGI